MQTAVYLMDKKVEVELSKAAEAALAQRQYPLYAEMELYFSCLIRLKVRFYEEQEAENSVGVNEKLFLCFRPVMTSQCDKDYQGAEPPLSDFPIINRSVFVPKWVSIDYKRGNWNGEFGMSKRR